MTLLQKRPSRKEKSNPRSKFYRSEGPVRVAKDQFVNPRNSKGLRVKSSADLPFPSLSRAAPKVTAAADAPSRRSGPPRTDRRLRRAPPSSPLPPRCRSAAGKPPARRNRRRHATRPSPRKWSPPAAPATKTQRGRRVRSPRVEPRLTRAPARPGSRWRAFGEVDAAAAEPACR